MIHLDAVDFIFSECRSEEVIGFFWRSVYITSKKEFTCDSFDV